jgi:hypothetical protein
LCAISLSVKTANNPIFPIVSPFGDQNSRTWLGLSSSSSALLLIAGISAGGWHETK